MTLHYRTYGSGQPLVIIHGIFGTHTNWHTLSERFAESYHVFAVDLRNHGQSFHSDAMDLQLMAEDIHEFVHEHNLGSAHVLGHSMGGKVAMQLAVRYPNHVDQLVVVDCAPRTYPLNLQYIIDALSAVDLAALTNRTDADAAITAAIPQKAVRQFLLKNLVRDDNGAFRWQLNLEAIRNNYTALSDNIAIDQPFTHPTLFVAGGHSNYIQPSDTETIHAIFPTSEIVTIPDVGHWIHAEAPQALAKLVLDFLKN